MTARTPAQEAKLAQLAQLHANRTLAAAEIDERQRREKAAELRDWELRESRLMNECRAAGIPKTAIGRAVGTSNWATLEARYALTASEDYTTPESPEFTVDKEASTFTLYRFNGQELAQPETVSFDGWGLGNEIVPYWEFSDTLMTLIQSQLREGNISFLDRWDEAVRGA